MTLNMNLLQWVLRIGIALTFLGHGMFAFYVKQSWTNYLTTVGFSEISAIAFMPYIGVLDFLVAVFILIKPYRFVVIWAIIWTLATALIRPISGEPIWDFVERGANWTCPLTLLILQNLNKNKN